MTSSGRTGNGSRTRGATEPLDTRRRRQLIEAAIASIAEHGLGGTTVLRVAGKAGLSAGIVNFYFRTKAAMLLATLEYVDRDFERRQRKALESAGDEPIRQLVALIDAGFDPAVCNPQRIAVWTAFWGEARAREDYMHVCGRRESQDVNRAVELFRRITSKSCYEHLDAEALGRAFYHLLSSLPEEMLDPRTHFDAEEARRTCRGFLRSVFPREMQALHGRRESAERRAQTQHRGASR